MPLNTIRISLTSFLAYFVMSAVITPLGIVSQPIADAFSLELTVATALFSWLTTGIFVGSVFAMFVFDWLRIKSVVILSSTLILLSLAVTLQATSSLSFSLFLFFTGLGCGVALSAAAVVITEVYSEKLRPSMLLLTDSFYSGAGTVSTLTGVFLLSQGWQWWSVYLIALGALLLLLALASTSRYPTKSQEIDSVDSIFSWHPAVYVCGLSLLVYLVGVVTIYSWVPNYAQQALGYQADVAGNLVSRFFSGMFFGQLAMFVLVLKLPIRSLIFSCLTLATIVTLSLWWQTELLSIQLAMLLLGLISGGIFKVLVAYGTTILETPSPKMVSYLLFNTALGTAIAPALSSWVVSQGSINSSMSFATTCYAVALALLLLTFWLAPSKVAK